MTFIYTNDVTNDFSVIIFPLGFTVVLHTDANFNIFPKMFLFVKLENLHLPEMEDESNETKFYQIDYNENSNP